MARRSGSGFSPQDVEALYSKRSTIKGGVSAAEPDVDPGEHFRLASGKVEQAFNHHDCQSVDDAHGDNYDNDHPNDWVRGFASGEGISDGRKPGFDYGGSWRRKNKGDTWE